MGYRSWLYGDRSIPVMDITGATACILAFVFALIWLSFPKHLPPGPRGFPLIGYMMKLYPKSLHVLLTDLSRLYDDPFTMWIGSVPVIVMNSLDTIYQAFAIKEYTLMEKNASPVVKKMMGNNCERQGLLWHKYGATYRTTRQFLLSAMYDFHEKGTAIEQIVAEEMKFLIDDYISEHGKAFDPRPVIRMSTANIIFTICISKRWQYPDDKLTEVLDWNRQMMLTYNSPMNKFPLLRFMPGSQVSKGCKSASELRKLIRTAVQEHSFQFNPQKPRDIADQHLIEMKEEREEAGRAPFAPGAVPRIEEIVALIVDVYNGAQDPLSDALSWLVLYLIKFPDVQERVKSEIDKVIGRDRLPTFEDRRQMPYTDAVISETLRHATVVTATPPHSLTRSTTLFAYNFPKEALVLCNLWALHRNDHCWESPDTFSPNRWIKKQAKDTESFMPFSTGIRQCPGQQMATTHMFLFLTMLMQRVSLKAAIEKEDLSLEGQVTVATRAPNDFKLIARPL